MTMETVNVAWEDHVDKHKPLMDRINNDYLKKALGEMRITAFSKMGHFNGTTGSIKVRVKRENKKVLVFISYVELGMNRTEAFSFGSQDASGRKYYKFFKDFMAKCVEYNTHYEMESKSRVR